MFLKKILPSGYGAFRQSTMLRFPWIESANAQCLVRHQPLKLTCLDMVDFFWDLRLRIKDTVEAIESLQDSHKTNMKKYRFDNLPDSKNLSKLIDPKIVKLCEKADASSFSLTTTLGACAYVVPNSYQTSHPQSHFQDPIG